ncbi:hypothetical protein ACJQWK_04281 [Exserohilum turcicum]|uniref:Uncharacterized protein n=1 Tax=Exserohilum turcicum (strain 28A) TaxID=671987 RepID=R0IAJ2_EXST2|nr:uncharacterized protein SETTUDRAFT_22453 [Exserohilum turcica Et28A]EOA82465.1 hypothetical protein SETTUDRAFT_22453 [Exserohilum turcica Et28A]
MADPVNPSSYGDTYTNPSQDQTIKVTSLPDANPQRALSPDAAAALYPNLPSGQANKDIRMLHPAAYLPPAGPYINPASESVTLASWETCCLTCFQPLASHDPPLERNDGQFPCPNECALAAPIQAAGAVHAAHPGQPCPRLYLTRRGAARRRIYRVGNPWLAGLQMYPSEPEWAVLTANGYIEPLSTYANRYAPAFTQKAWAYREPDAPMPLQIAYKHERQGTAPIPTVSMGGNPNKRRRHDNWNGQTHNRPYGYQAGPTPYPMEGIRPIT